MRRRRKYEAGLADTIFRRTGVRRRERGGKRRAPKGNMKKSIIVAAVISVLAAWSVRAEDGKALYDNKCAKCHGEDGKGQKTMGKKLGCKDYTDPKVQDELKDDAAVKSIKEGLKKDDKTLMKPAEGLTDDQIKGLVAYMRTFKK
jgi:mono/diheme cytochrome c family protein